MRKKQDPQRTKRTRKRYIFKNSTDKEPERPCKRLQCNSHDAHKSKRCGSIRGSRLSGGWWLWFALPFLLTQTNALELSAWPVHAVECDTGPPIGPPVALDLDCLVQPWQRSRVGLPMETTFTAMAYHGPRTSRGRCLAAAELKLWMADAWSEVQSDVVLLFRFLGSKAVQWAYPFAAMVQVPFSSFCFSIFASAVGLPIFGAR